MAPSGHGALSRPFFPSNLKNSFASVGRLPMVPLGLLAWWSAFVCRSSECACVFRPSLLSRPENTLLSSLTLLHWDGHACALLPPVVLCAHQRSAPQCPPPPMRNAATPTTIVKVATQQTALSADIIKQYPGPEQVALRPGSLSLG